MLELRLAEITDETARENFKRVQEFVGQNPYLSSSSVLLEVSFGKAETHLKIPHGLSFQPKDVILTSSTGTGKVTIEYDQFDRKNLVFSTTGACKIRVLVGTLGGS